MSRIGKKPVEIKSGVTVTIDGTMVNVKGPKGELSEMIDPSIKVKVENNQVIVERPSNDKKFRALHGLYRSLIQNMVLGVTAGFSKKLDIVGVGYKVDSKGRGVQFALGYSHPIFFVPPPEIKVETPTPTSLVVSGISKQLVGQIAAKIRSLRPPEPYKGKGVKYSDERILRKAGKTAGK